MGQTLYLECNSGISGDMAVAALLDLGAEEEVLARALDSLPLSGYEVQISRVKKAGLDVCDFLVKLDEGHENHDHDMEYLYGHRHGYEHSHEAEREEGGHCHAHEHRGLSDIRQIIERSALTGRAKATAFRIFDILARAEARAHGVDMSEVHFHEVGAVDSIVDVAAVAVCLDNLDITDVVVPYLCEGGGTVRCQHGILPVPVPAVANIAEQHGLILRMTGVSGELVTPTGAAIVAAIRTSERLPEQFRVRRVGMGAGKRQYELPGILRAMLIETEEEMGADADEIVKMETNIDDCSGEMLGYVMERLFEHGAKDVFYTPVYMKKNRPAYQLTVICGTESAGTLENIIFRETTTVGIRRVAMERTVLEREEETVSTEDGELRVKRCTLPDGTVRRYPEYESAAELAAESGRPLPEILRCSVFDER